MLISFHGKGCTYCPFFYTNEGRFDVCQLSLTSDEQGIMRGGTFSLPFLQASKLKKPAECPFLYGDGTTIEVTMVDEEG